MAEILKEWCVQTSATSSDSTIKSAKSWSWTATSQHLDVFTHHTYVVFCSEIWMMAGLSDILKEWCVRPPATSTCMCLPNFQLKLRLQEEVSNVSLLFPNRGSLFSCHPSEQSWLIGQQSCCFHCDGRIMAQPSKTASILCQSMKSDRLQGEGEEWAGWEV